MIMMVFTESLIQQLDYDTNSHSVGDIEKLLLDVVSLPLSVAHSHI